MSGCTTECVPADVLADLVAPGCSIPGRGAKAAMMGASALENMADEIAVLVDALDDDGTLERNVLHRIAERARAASQVVAILHRREIRESADRIGGTFRAAEPAESFAAEE